MSALGHPFRPFNFARLFTIELGARGVDGGDSGSEIASLARAIRARAPHLNRTYSAIACGLDRHGSAGVVRVNHRDGVVERKSDNEHASQYISSTLVRQVSNNGT